MRVARCPSCGAEVRFMSSASIMAVCDYCRSTLVRHDTEIENIGVMADLAEDASPVRMGLVSSWEGVGFSVIGRLQLQYAEGYWNEWFCQFHDGREGWISEGSGLCYVTFPVAAKAALPPLEKFKVGQRANLAGAAYTVTNIENATCVAVQGELPFTATAGWAAPSVDLRTETGGFASLDFSSTPPGIYLGKVVELADIIAKASVLPEAKARKAAAQAFKCKQCGGPIKVTLEETRAVGCPSCGSIVDVKDPNLSLISRSSARMSVKPKLALGSSGKLRGVDFTILGFMRRSMVADGDSYTWDEYLLHAKKEGFRWLSEYDGHWNFARACTGLPKEAPPKGGREAITYLSKKYLLFQHYTARVDYVLGEFNWRVQLGDEVYVEDYISPPLLLSMEQTDKELAWTLAEYLPPADIASAFNPTEPLPEPEGIAPNQPSPHEGKAFGYWLVYALFVFLAIVVQMVTSIASGNVVYGQRIELEPREDHKSFTSPAFKFGGSDGNLMVTNEAAFENQWLTLDMVLTNKETGQQFAMTREISHYTGYDDEDGSWSEGDKVDTAQFDGVPAGEYILEIEAETEAGHNETVASRLRIERNKVTWTNFWLFGLLLLIAPVVVSWRSRAFEKRRWAEGDPPVHISTSSTADDD